MELRITDTNSANDSKGRAFGLEGNNYLYILVAFVAAIGSYILLNVLLRLSMSVAFCLALPILLIPSAWVLLFKHNKPEGYAGDLFDSLINREGWSHAPYQSPSHEYIRRS